MAPGPLAPIVKAASTLRSIHDWVFCEQRYNCPRSFHLAGINHLSIYHVYLKSTSTTYDDQEVSTSSAGHESLKKHRIHCGFLPARHLLGNLNVFGTTGVSVSQMRL